MVADDGVAVASTGGLLGEGGEWFGEDDGAENLTDRQAALAVRCRIDWKYCLGLELTDPGFDHSVLSEGTGWPGAIGPMLCWR